jgi:MFS family permease
MTTAPARPALPPQARRLFLGIAFSSLGSGMSMPYLFVYLTQVRHLPLTSVGLLMSWMAVLSLGVAPLCGTLVDRFGPRPVLVVSLVGEAIGMALVATIHALPGAVGVASFVAVFSYTTHPASSALLARMVPAAGRQRAYGVQFMLMNAGFGVGGLVSSLLVDLARPVTFERLYLIDAVTYLGYIVVLLSFPRGTGRVPEADAEADAATGAPGGKPPGWRLVLRDRTLLAVVAAGTLLLTCAYAQVDSGFTAFAVSRAKVPAQTLGWAFAANTAMIVVGQLVTLRWVEGRRRSRALGVAGLIWALAWAVIGLAWLSPGQWPSVLCVVLGLAVFGAGETIWAPVMPALVNGLAVERLRGRYNALSGMTWTISGIVGPALAGVLLGSAGAGWWVALCVGGSLLGGGAFLTLRRRLTPTQDGLATTTLDPTQTPARATL